MSVVLSILQILGWILLIVLLVIIAALLILLFCPVHYLVEGEWLEEKWARFKAHWLLHLFRVKISYGDDLVYGEINALWKKMTFSFDLTKKAEEVVDEAEEILEDVAEGMETASEDDKEEKVIGTESAAELRGESALGDDVEPNAEHDVEADEKTNAESDAGANAESDENTSGEEEISNDEQTESIISKIKGIIERIKEVYPKIKKILTDEQNQDAVKHLKDEVIYLIKILLPKKSKIDAVFSTGSPDTTGQLCGVLACFPAIYHEEWRLLPDFEADDPYFKGTFWGKGRLSGYQLTGIVLRIVFDKNCRRLYTIISKFIKWLKKDDKSQEEK